MKDFIKGRWFPLVVAIVCVAILAAFLFVSGFRVTYAPELENSWDAVSAVASWVGVMVSVVGVVVSGLAIYYAVQVPKKIADRQDKIALFDKRFVCYMTIQDFVYLASQLKKVNTADEVICCYQTILNGKSGARKKITNESSLADMIKAESILISGEFLFSTYDVKLWENVLDELSHLMVSLNKRHPQHPDEKLTDDELAYKNEFCRLCKKFDEEYLKVLEQEMDLKKN